MRIDYQFIAKLFAANAVLFASIVFAQEPMEKKEQPIVPEIRKETAPVKAVEAKVDSTKAPAAKKMVQDATINLQTTITGNQEQPRVLYILPWQSPQAASVDFEPLDSQQKAVFNHVEREELRRELESAGELQ